MTDVHVQQEKAVNLLIDWNKWLAGLNFGAATGCIVVIEKGVEGIVKNYLIGAVFFFALSIIISSLIFTVLPSIMQQLPIQNKEKNKGSIYDYRPFASLSLKFIVSTQVLAFMLGVACLFLWVFLDK